jgi:hypothetical protein
MYLASRQMYICTRVLNMSIVLSFPPVTFPLGPAGGLATSSSLLVAFANVYVNTISGMFRAE